MWQLHSLSQCSSDTTRLDLSSGAVQACSTPPAQTRRTAAASWARQTCCLPSTRTQAAATLIRHRQQRQLAQTLARCVAVLARGPALLGRLADLGLACPQMDKLFSMCTYLRLCC